MPHINWKKTADNTWTSPAERGYTAVIVFAPLTNLYTLTITGSGAPSPADYATRGLAKDAFRIYLLDK